MDVSQACPGGVIPKASNLTTSLAGMALKFINMTGTDTLVRFTISMPMLADRNYTTVGITGPSFAEVQPECTADKLFETMVSIPAATGCTEGWNITADFSNLRRCGFEISEFNDLTTGYQYFDGALRVKFIEPLEVGTGKYAVNVTRNVTVDYPVRVAFDSNYVTAMEIYMLPDPVPPWHPEFNVSFAITGQNIPKDPTPETANVTATVTYMVQYPFAISAWNEITSSNPAITGEMMEQMTPEKMCQNEIDYTKSDNATANPAQVSCRKSDNAILFTTAANTAESCKFDGYLYTLSFSVFCGVNVPWQDCPLGAPDETGIVQFNITSENFCTNLAETDNINGVITITDFYAVVPDDYETRQNAWL